MINGLRQKIIRNNTIEIFLISFEAAYLQKLDAELQVFMILHFHEYRKTGNGSTRFLRISFYAIITPNKS